MNNIFSSKFYGELKYNVVIKTFPLLNTFDVGFITKLLINTIYEICMAFCFDIKHNFNLYYNQFIQNDYLDVKGILFLLLPYINESTGPLHTIRSLYDIYHKKQHDVDINKASPTYTYSNFQYGRVYRDKNNNIEIMKDSNDIRYIIRDNYNLLKKTLKIISNKLFVNWINVRPYTTSNIIHSELYKNTIDEIKNGKYFDYNTYTNEMNPDNKTLRQVLYIGDYYNTITNYLYHKIKNNKWIIYTIYDGNILKPYISIFASVLPIDGTVNEIDWNNLDDDTRYLFVSQWNYLLTSFDESFNLLGIQQYKIEDMLYKFAFFFDKYYKNVEKISQIDNYIKLQNNTDDSFKKIKKNDLIISLKSIKSEYVYEFIKDTMEKIKPTWYFRRLVKYDKKYMILKYEEYFLDILNNYSIYSDFVNDTLSVKIFYNYAKSLTKFKNEKDEEIIFPRFWRSCTENSKKIIMDRLSCKLSDTELEWFNIINNIKIIYGTDNGKLIVDGEHVDFTQEFVVRMNQKIHKAIRYVITDVVFNILVENGILSIMIPDKLVTDKSLFPTDIPHNKYQLNKLKDTILNDTSIREIWNNSYYFLTNEPYNQLPCMECSTNTKKYLECIGEAMAGGDWYANYAVDWIAQISFFHRYIHSRVLYVTGGTGVGKSTQTPKLLLYATKMIDYKTTGNIICTIPRIPPVTGVANYVSKQMGVPREKYIKFISETVSSSNYYIQYKHSKSSHVKDINFPSIKFVTDGLLYQELLTQPVLKKIKNKQILLNNIYDVVMIDESHEHNKNMDILLTLLKYAIYYNNDTRLVIVSATMDSDEPVYRRYYRDINNNRLYPFDQDLQTYNLDRINIERRIHISEPGKFTKYKIKEIYKPNSNIIKIVSEILASSDNGDILIFQPGQYDIIKLVKQLNDNTPNEVIAIPYFSELSQEKRNFIENLSANSMYNFVLPKYIDYHLNIDDVTYETVAKGTYKRIIIVSTNIAEASITINSLKYVIDNGEQKVNEYNPDTRESLLIKTQISESSRLQRKGRVGRVSDGTVYYLYKEGTMTNNKTLFNICMSNNSDTFFDLLINTNECTKLFDYENDPDIPIIMYNKLIPRNTTHTIPYIIEQYFIEGKFIDYIGNKYIYDYGNWVIPMTCWYNNDYKFGYHYNIINDMFGMFYIIHPEETNLYRNINGDIIDVSDYKTIVFNKNMRYILSSKITSYWEILKEQFRVYSEKIYKYGNNFYTYYKTQYGLGLSELIRVLNMYGEQSIKKIISLLYSRKYDVFDDVLKFIVFSDLLPSCDLNKIIYTYHENKSTKADIASFKSRYGSKYGDVIGIINIANKIIDFIQNNLNIDISAINTDIVSPLYLSKLEQQKKIYINNKKSGIFVGLTPKIIEIFSKLDGTNKLKQSYEIGKDEQIEFIKNNYLYETFIEVIKKNKEKINIWSKNNKLDSKFVYNYIIYYITFIDKINKYDNKLFDINYDIIDNYIPLQYFDSMLQIYKKEPQKELNILKSFLHGYGTNIGRLIDNTQFYLNIINPTIKYIHVLKKNILTLLYNKNNYIMYMVDNNSEMACINNITPNMIIDTNYSIYVPSKLSISIYTHIKHVKSLFASQKENISKHTALVSNYIHTANTIKYDLLQLYNPNLFSYSTNLNNKYNNKQKNNKEFYKSYNDRNHYNNILTKKINNESTIYASMV
jgi:hypothetical protein